MLPGLGHLDDPAAPRLCAATPPAETAEAVGRASARGDVFKVQLALAAGVLPFAFTWVVNRAAWIGYVVFANGVVFHMSAALDAPFTRLAHLWDVSWNVALCIYVNVATHWQPGTALLTALSAAAWLLKKRLAKSWWFLVHVVMVQWLLCLLLYVFESRRA